MTSYSMVLPPKGCRQNLNRSEGVRNKKAVDNPLVFSSFRGVSLHGQSRNRTGYTRTIHPCVAGKYSKNMILILLNYAVCKVTIV
jgi:hypothetical protein